METVVNITLLVLIVLLVVALFLIEDVNIPEPRDYYNDHQG